MSKYKIIEPYKLKKYVLMLASTLLFLFICVFFMLSEVDWEKSQRAAFKFDDRLIYSYTADEGEYVFLPSYAREEDLEKCRKIFGDSVTIMQSENLPTIFIETKTGTIDHIFENSETREPGNILVKDADGKILYKSNLKHIKGKGNQTFWGSDKKSLAFSLFSEASILGIASGEKYTLISNIFDSTMIRNDIARQMGRRMGLTQSTGAFVDLYLNGEYYGNYYLTEQVEVSEDRINIRELEEFQDELTGGEYTSFPIYSNKHAKALSFDLPQDMDISGGYIVEREYRDRWVKELEENISVFTTNNEEDFIVKYPKNCSDEQIQYLTVLFNDIENAVLAVDGMNPDTGMHYGEYIDVDSFVRKYLLEEVCKNYDGGVTSSFFYKDSDLLDSSLKAGPIWDYDMTWGNYRHREMKVVCEEPEGITKLSLNSNSTKWYEALYEKEEFRTLVCKVYSDEITGFLEELCDHGIEEYENYLRASWDMNYVRWKNELEGHDCFYKDRMVNYEELKEYIEKRKEFLDSVWIDGKEYFIVEFRKDNSKVEIRYIEKGKTLGTLPLVEDSTEWQCKDFEMIETETAVLSDMLITCESIGNVN